MKASAGKPLQDGKHALAVALETLETLRRSEQIQRQLVRVGRQSLAEVVEINQQLPRPPIFPATTPGCAPAPEPIGWVRTLPTAC